MPVEGAIPHVRDIEMYGSSIPAETAGGDLFEYINFQQRYDIDARIQRALQRSKEYLQPLPVRAAPRNSVAELTLLSPGDIFFLYTDGVYDGTDTEERQRLEQVM